MQDLAIKLNYQKQSLNLIILHQKQGGWFLSNPRCAFNEMKSHICIVIYIFFELENIRISISYTGPTSRSNTKAAQIAFTIKQFVSSPLLGGKFPQLEQTHHCCTFCLSNGEILILERHKPIILIGSPQVRVTAVGLIYHSKWYKYRNSCLGLCGLLFSSLRKTAIIRNPSRCLLTLNGKSAQSTTMTLTWLSAPGFQGRAQPQ